MRIFRGFELHLRVGGGPVPVYARHLPETGPWHGFGAVGTMPDVACARTYVDWLHDTGPENASTVTIEDCVDGHFVVVRGDEPDEGALLAWRLAGIAQALRGEALDAGVVKRAFGDLVHTIGYLDVAADQASAARAVGNFFLTSERKGGVRHETMHLGNFGMPGKWNGYGRIATGIGDGWVPAIALMVMEKPVSAFRDRHVVAADAPSRSARRVFVAGREPRIDASSREDLRHCEEVLRSCLGWSVTAETAERLTSVADVLDEVSVRLGAPLSEPIPEESPSPVR